MLEAVTYSNFRQSLKKYLKQVNQDSEPLIVTNKRAEDNVVVLSKDDYDAMVETMRIMSNPDLVAKIKRGDEQFAKGQFQKHDLIEEDDV